MGTSVLARLYWPLWVVTTMLTGVLSGYMVSHSIMFGQFFNWYIESDNLELLRQTYTTFRDGSNAYKIYDIPLLLHLIAGTALSCSPSCSDAIALFRCSRASPPGG